jgi:hypothetical protein
MSSRGIVCLLGLMTGIPTNLVAVEYIDLDQDAGRQVVVDREDGH